MSNQVMAQNFSQSQINMMGRWVAIWKRCYLPQDPGYEYYGARGICVCQEWMDFQSFYSFWGDPPFEDATIGRIDNDGNYEPGNCEWQSQEQQNNNTRRSRLITWNGKTQSIRDWAFEYNIGTHRLSERLRRGWDMQKALTTPCPQDFATELADRKRRNKEIWDIKGQLYQTRAKHRRGVKLSLHLQDLLAVEGADPSAPHKRKTISSRQQKQILAARKKGSTIKEIADLLNIPKSTVHLFLQKQP
jgi:hypothetical protein